MGIPLNVKMLILIDEQEVIRFVGGVNELVFDRYNLCSGLLH